MHKVKKYKGLEKKLFIVRQILKMVYKNILSDALRSFMTCLGIIIGTASLIVMMSMMDIRMEKKAKEMDEQGYSEIEIDLFSEYLTKGFLESQIEVIRNIDNVAAVSPRVETSGNTDLKVGSVRCKDVEISGVSEAYFENSLRNIIIDGNAFNKSDVENESNVCVINKKTAEKLFGKAEASGKSISIMGKTFLIKGVSKAAGAGNEDYTVRIPYNVLSKMTGNGIRGFTVYPVDHASAEAVDDEVCDYLQNLIHGSKWVDFGDNFNKFTLHEEEDKIKRATNLQMVIAAIALIIGGIGIMNMMLVMVTERTAEIGLRKALGSSRRRIQFQFVVESMMLSITGGIIGVVVGVLFSVCFCISTKEQIHVNIPATVIGLIFSSAVGVFFGWSPAKAASELRPIDALKGE